MARIKVLETSKDYSGVVLYYNPFVEIVEVTQNGEYKFKVFINSRVQLEMDGYKFVTIREALDSNRPMTIVINNQEVKKIIIER